MESRFSALTLQGRSLKHFGLGIANSFFPKLIGVFEFLTSSQKRLDMDSRLTLLLAFAFSLLSSLPFYLSLNPSLLS